MIKSRLDTNFARPVNKNLIIATEAASASADIGKIIRKINGQYNNGGVDLKDKSIETQAIYLFSIGKTPLEVAIEVILPVLKFMTCKSEFWALNDLHELAFVYNEIKVYLPSFLKLVHCLKERHMLNEKHIIKFLRYANYDLSDLANNMQCLSNEIISLEGQKRNLISKLILWNAQLSDLGRA